MKKINTRRNFAKEKFSINLCKSDKDIIIFYTFYQAL